MCDSWKMWNKQSSYFSRERNSAFFNKFSLSREVRLLFFLNKEKIIKYNQIMIYISFECLRCFLESEKLMINNFFVWKNPFSLGLRIDQNDQSSVPMIAESFKKIKKYRWLWFEKSKWLDINLSIQKKKKVNKMKMFSLSRRRKRRVVGIATWPGLASAPAPKLVGPSPDERSPAPCQKAACPSGSAHAAHKSNPYHTPESVGLPGLCASLAHFHHVLMMPSPPSPAGSPCLVSMAEMLHLPPSCKERSTAWC